MSDRCFVYIISIDGSGLRKVGISSAPESRLAALCTGSPYAMTLERMYPFPSRKEAAIIEALFHERNARDRTRGEWFNMDFGTAQDRVNCEISEYLIFVRKLGESDYTLEMAGHGIPEDDSAIYWFDRADVA